MRGALAIVIGLGFGVPACQSIPSQPPATDLKADLDEMLTWFPGVYDNYQQIEDERLSDLKTSLRHRHLNHTFHPVSIPGIPGRQLYAQQYQHHEIVFDPGTKTDH